MNKSQSSQKPILGTVATPELKEGEDFYINNNGLFVFTEIYHLKRGACCKNGCLHCPYNFKNKKSK